MQLLSVRGGAVCVQVGNYALKFVRHVTRTWSKTHDGIELEIVRGSVRTKPAKKKRYNSYRSRSYHFWTLCAPHHR